ncbi:sulfotransferase [Stella sp.]|uniref:sulfotransferase family protein n=1 Tax=Stella sp. TaxID=2912054 RepID=UPI0035B153E6
MSFPPLVLVSQAHRSGGSLMAQLFDDHPELYAHPFEIHIGHPDKWLWPDLDLAASPETWFERLFERKLERYVQHGFAKAGHNVHAVTDRRRFDIDLGRMRELFLAEASALGRPSQRAILDAYFRSFFGAWRDWHASGRERWLTGFTPFTITVASSVGRLGRDYPDGRIITLVRDPRSWRVSCRTHDRFLHGDLDRSVGIWRQSAECSLALARHNPDRVLLATYERLVTETEATMRRVATFLGVEFLPTLLRPTFLGRELRPNSSFAVAQYGINQDGVDRSDQLDEAERTAIDREAMPLYEEIEAFVAARSR